MNVTEYPKAIMYEKNAQGFMTIVCEVQLPPPGVARMAALWKYRPEGGAIVDIDKDHIGFFDAEGNLVRLIG